MESADAEGWMAGGGELPETVLSNALGGRADVLVEVLPCGRSLAGLQVPGVGT